MATKIDIVSVDQIGNEVTADHFGGNLVYTRNNDHTGAGNAEFWQGVEALGVTDIRYPGGTVAETDIDISQMPNGQLRPELVAFLEQLQTEYASAAGQARQAILVLRTREEAGLSDAAWADQIERFVEVVTRDYGHLISAFQIGNEYWNVQGAGHDEFSYGHRADLAAIAVQAGIEASGSAYDPEIVVQMANPATGGSAFNRASVEALTQLPFELLNDIEQEFLRTAAQAQGVSVDDINTGRLWYHRIEYANKAIVSELSPEAREAIDAVVEHYYIRDPIEDLTFNFTRDDGQINSSMVSNIDRKFDTWTEELGRDVELYVTEWGLNLDNENNHGIKEGSITLEQFEHMIKLGVDHAYAWPVVHNTEVSLGAFLGRETRIDDHGITTENHRGTVFDLMASHLIGLNQLDITHSAADTPFEVNAYGNEGRMVFYVSSRIEQTESFSFDIDALGHRVTGVSAIHVGYGETYAPGTTPHHVYSGRWARDVDAITVDGEVLFINDDRMQASTTHLHEGALYKGGEQIELTLRPFEMVQLEFHLNDGALVEGTGANNRLSGTDANDILRGFDGDDHFIASAGVDRFEGGEGRDMVDYSATQEAITANLSWSLANTGVAEMDSYVSIEGLTAGLGDDKLTGDAADNRLLGDGGNDTLIGLDGDDLLLGGEGRDQLVGHRGNDRLFGGGGDDFVFGDPGDDTLYGDAGNDFLSGGRGADVFVFTKGDENDRVVDFSLHDDQIKISRYIEADMTAYYEASQDSVILAFDDGDRLEIFDHSDVDAIVAAIIW